MNDFFCQYLSDKCKRLQNVQWFICQIKNITFDASFALAVLGIALISPKQCQESLEIT